MTDIVTSMGELAAKYELEVDTRFKHWAKVITAGTPIAGGRGGYALGGSFQKGNFAVSEGDYAVLAAESGSRAHHPYRYRLLRNVEGKMVQVKMPTERRRSMGLSAPVLAEALNSTLYAYACAIERKLGPEGEGAPKLAADAPPVVSQIENSLGLEL